MYRATVTNAANEGMKKYIGLANNTHKEKQQPQDRFQTSEIPQLRRISQIYVGIEGKQYRPNNQMGNIK